MKLFLTGFAAAILLIILLIATAFFAFRYYVKKKLETNMEPVELTDTLTSTVIADYNFTIHSFANETSTSLSDFKGKVIFLNFWETWCGPCVAEMKGIEKLYEAVGGNGIAFLIVSTVAKQNTGEFIAKKGYRLPFYHLETKLPPVFNGRSIPRTYIISGEGKIILWHNGMAQWFTGETVKFMEGLR